MAEEVEGEGDGGAEFPDGAEVEQTRLSDEERALIFASWAKDPAKFCAQVFDRRPREFQPTFMRLIRDHPRTAIRACRRAGKTALASYVALWWLCTRPGSLVVTTAPTNRQVEKVLWKELRALWASSKLPMLWPQWEVLTTEIKTHRVDWTAMGFSSDTGDRIEGLHGGPTLVIFDEAKAVAREVYEAFQGMFASDQPWRQLAISTPGSKVGWYYECFYGKERHLWQKLAIRADQIPRLAKTCEEERLRRGENNPLYLRNQLAEFKGEEHGQLFVDTDLERAVNREMRRNEGDEWDVIMAVDPAGTGPDETVVCMRVGPVIKWIEPLETSDEMETVGRIAQIWRDEQLPKGARLIVDRPGLGGPMISRLVELGLPAESFNPGAKAHDSETFANLKTEVAYGLRDRLAADEVSLPEDDQLIAQLSSYTTAPTSRGQDKLVDPEGDSPDRGDAVLIAFAADLMVPGVATANVWGA